MTPGGDTPELLAEVRALRARAAQTIYDSVLLRLRLEHSIHQLRAAIQDSYSVRGKEQLSGSKRHGRALTP